MKVRHITSSTVVVEAGDTRVLCDPWLVDGAFYGAWAHYPPLEYEPEDFDDVDYIYVSHVHPDHCHAETLERLDSSIPVLVHDYQWDFLRHNIEAAGFTVHELDHDDPTTLSDDLQINVLASDNCDPEVCGNHFACPWFVESASTDFQPSGSTQLDSLAVFDDGEQVVVNVNDCRWPMTKRAAREVRDRYGEVDLLLHQYTFAGGYPQARLDYSHDRLLEAAEERRLQSLESAVGFLELFEPTYHVPFAGSYALAGNLAPLDRYVARSLRSEAKEYFDACERVDDATECVLLNSGEFVDVATGERSAPYTPIDPEARRLYVEAELAGASFPFEDDPVPDMADFEAVFPEAYEHFDERRRAMGFESETEVCLSLVDGHYARFTADGAGFEYVEELPERTDRRRVRLEMDPRLTRRVLKGPRYAHFNNAYIGSHLRFAIEPDEYERALFYALSFLHV